MTAAHRLEVRPVARLFRALGDETRLRIVALLSCGELCVCHIQEALDLTQPNASRQLAILRSAGIVDQRREGNWIHYRLVEQSDRECEHMLRAITGSYAKRDRLRRDVEKLLKLCGPGACS